MRSQSAFLILQFTSNISKIILPSILKMVKNQFALWQILTVHEKQFTITFVAILVSADPFQNDISCKYNGCMAYHCTGNRLLPGRIRTWILCYAQGWKRTTSAGFLESAGDCPYQWSYLSVWRRGGEQETCTFLPLPAAYHTQDWDGADMIVNQIYPVEEKQHVSVNLDHKITVEYDQPIMARVFRVILKK